MSATLIGNNVTLKISSAVSATVSANNTTSTLYTCPANSYAILNVYVTSSSASTSNSIQVDGKTVILLGNGAVVPSVTTTSSASAGFTLYVGPSQVITVVSAGIGVVTANVTGVCFINSP